jgi:hypothetical protein
MSDLAEKLKIGIKDTVSYPISVAYCGNCSMPIEVSKLYPQKLRF